MNTPLDVDIATVGAELQTFFHFLDPHLHLFLFFVTPYVASPLLQFVIYKKYRVNFNPDGWNQNADWAMGQLTLKKKKKRTLKTEFVSVIK